MRKHLVQKSQMKRRLSEPNCFAGIHLDSKPSWKYISDMHMSVDLVYLRQSTLRELLDPQFAYMWKHYSKNAKKKVARETLQSCWLNPRLPVEMRQLVTSRTEKRRHTIGEPERLGTVVRALLAVRRDVAQLRRRCDKRDKMPVRRRSFDVGEILDEEQGDINGQLQLEVSKPLELQSKFDIQSDSIRMEQAIFQARFRRLDDPFEAMGSGGTSSQQWSAVTLDSEVTIWKEYYAEASPYYYNDLSGESVWDYPLDSNSQVLTQYQDTDGTWYWYNYTTGEYSLIE